MFQPVLNGRIFQNRFEDRRFEILGRKAGDFGDGAVTHGFAEEADAGHRVGRTPGLMRVAPTAVRRLRDLKTQIAEHQRHVGGNAVPARGPEGQEGELGIGIVAAAVGNRLLALLFALPQNDRELS